MGAACSREVPLYYLCISSYIILYIYVIFPCSSFPPAGSLHWPFGILKMQLLATSPTSG